MAQHQGRVFVLCRPCLRRRDELQVVHHDESDLAQRIEPLEHRLKVLAGKRQQRERESPEPHGRSAHTGTRLIGELGGTQLVHRDLPLDRQRALHQPLFIHLAGEIRHAHGLLRHPQGDPERERRLPAADVAAHQDQVAAPESAAEQFVERPEAGGHGVARDFTGLLGIHALDQVVERCTFFEAARGRGHDL